MFQAVIHEGLATRGVSGGPQKFIINRDDVLEDRQRIKNKLHKQSGLKVASPNFNHALSNKAWK